MEHPSHGGGHGGGHGKHNSHGRHDDHGAHAAPRPRPAFLKNFARFAATIWIAQFLAAIYACVVANRVFGIALEAVVNVQLALQIALPFAMALLEYDLDPIVAPSLRAGTGNPDTAVTPRMRSIASVASTRKGSANDR